ncbi:RNA polymerase sigma factor [Streptomyces chartreusis]|uniref:RNA polymerase sigma factor n=1 Tax=Streptomyces chartreusis TaxID=1969 RepID=UPI0036F73898
MDEWDGFEAVYRTTYRPVLRFLIRRLPLSEAEDAAAEVFVVAWRRWEDSPGEPLPWLYGIARRVAANHQRSSARAGRLWKRLEAAALEDSEDSAEENVLGRLGAAHALAGLSETDREVLLLVSWDGLDARAAAQVMGRSRAAFAVQLHRARMRLERSLAPRKAIPAVTQPAAAQGRTR